jgi:ferric-dicitrate binding protein FerR (iron transport regulator)
MSPPGPGAHTEEMAGELEQRARALLEDSVLRIDGRVRSRLNQARYAAVEEASRRPSFWRRFSLMPAASAVAAAALVAFVLWPHSRHQGDSIIESGHGTVEDLDLLADGDALDLVSDETDGGAFYEWAVEQSDSNETSTGA